MQVDEIGLVIYLVRCLAHRAEADEERDHQQLHGGRGEGAG